MIVVRPSSERGHFDHGWLRTYHSFSFAEYQDPEHMGFRSLRVINEDTVKPGQGFPTHGHRDMEIITYILEGELEHKDSMGTGSVIKPGDIQRMSAGTGIRHSEFNHSKKDSVHLLQIWILPGKGGLAPSYEQKSYPPQSRVNRLFLAASGPRGGKGVVKIHQDAELFVSKLDAGVKIKHVLKKGRHAWIQVARGAVKIGGHFLRQGDGAAVSDESEISIETTDPSEILLFDLA